MRVPAAALAVVLAGAAVAPAEAQYFGRNKVQYETFDFQVLETEHFDIHYYPEAEQAAKLAGRMAERWYARLSRVLGHELRGRQPLILYASPPDFWQTNAIPGEIGEGTGGVTESIRRRIVLPFAGPLADTDHVLGHELVHAFQFDIGGMSGRGGLSGVHRLPLWFVEGMAEYLSLGPADTQTAMWVRDALEREALPSLDDLNDPRYFPYRWGHAFWAYVAGRWGDEAVGAMLRAASTGGVEAAIAEVLGTEPKELTAAWHEALGALRTARASDTRPLREVARPLVTRETTGGRINVAPELSPDGRWITFFSERDLFSIDLFVADARTGEVVRKLTDTATDPHFESLQFLSSAGAWSPDSRRVALATISSGKPHLTIVDPQSGDTLQEVEFAELGEILNPAWSPDGRRLAFSALAGGVLDLYVYDLEAGRLRQLTDDEFAELDPEWTPDGRAIAVSTDRFTSRLDSLAFGPPRLALVDVETGAVEPLETVTEGKATSPRYAAGTLYFLSDRTGITNVYRLELDTGEVRQVTRLPAGISGFTALTPALAAAPGRLAFSVLSEDGYDLYAIEDQERLAGGSLQPAPALGNVLPPWDLSGGEVRAALRQPTQGLPERTDWPTKPYAADWGLDFVAQPSVGIGRDAFGSYIGGGIALGWSDLLGNHTILTTAQLNGSLDELGGSVGYLNRERRWDWGGGVSQVPYVTRGFRSFLTTVDGEPAVAERELRALQIVRGVSGAAEYAFNRAMRVELFGGWQQIGFDLESRTRAFSTIDGDLLSDRKETLASRSNINMAQAGAALVGDTSIFGVTSPVLGQRYRLELQQTSGTLSYTTALADARRYFMPVRPYTIALRGLFAGRFGGDADDDRLFPQFLGYPTLVRGYGQDSFSLAECGPLVDGTCQIFDQLLGSRMLVANAELRFPVWGGFGGEGFYGPLPLELALFGDAGLAWTGNDEPSFAGGTREWVRSVGIALRANLFGFAVGEIDFVKPLDRPDDGWMWQFSLAPGF